jgi:hypothetical protein
MSLNMRWLLGLAAVAVVAAYTLLAPVPSPPEPFTTGEWRVESVMVLDPATTTMYNLAPPFRVIRDGHVTLARRDEATAERAVRIDLLIEGEPVTIYTRLRN